MAKNGLGGVNENVVQLNDVSTFTFSPSDTYAAVGPVPAGGNVLKLPTNPAPGDRYEFACIDGSCDGASPITVETQDRTTIQGATSVSFAQPYSWGVFVYQGGVSAPGTWMLYSETNAAGGNLATMYSATPTSQTAGAAFCAIMACALEVKGSGVFRASWHADYACDTTAENISIELVAIPFATQGAFGAGSSSFAVSSDAFVGNAVLAPAAQTNAGLAPFIATLGTDAAGTAANGLTYAGVPLNDSATGALQITVSKTPTLTNLLSGSGAGGNTAVAPFSGSVLFTKSINAKGPYVQGTWLVLAIAVKGTAGVLHFVPASLTLEEVTNG